MSTRKKILYIGNKLAIHGKSPTSVDLLSGWFQNENLDVVSSSSQTNKVFRLGDMIRTFFEQKDVVDLVLIDTYSTQNFYYAVVIAKLCRIYGVPYFPVLHGGDLPLRLKKNSRMSKSLFANAKMNVSPSMYMKHQFTRSGIENVIYIPNTIDLSKYPFKLRKSIKTKLLWVRSFAEIYNPLLALEVVEILLKKGLDVELCMVGPEKDGSLQNCKKVAAELNLPITFTGILKKEEWIDLSKKYDIFINTTNFDNMPVSVMEAMALGLPVISTNVGGLPFLIDSGKDGVLIEPNNAQMFVDEILALCSNPAKTEIISKNARSKMEKFDWEVVKHKWIKLFDF